MRALEMFDIMNQSRGKRLAGKVTLIDAQLRFVREVDGSIEYVTRCFGVDQLTNFMQTYFTKQTR